MLDNLEPQQEVEELISEEVVEDNLIELDEIEEDLEKEESTEEEGEEEEGEEVSETEEGEETEEVKPVAQKKRKKNKTFERREKKLALQVFEMREQERATHEAIEKLRLAQEKADIQNSDTPKPLSEDFDTHDEYIDAITGWSAQNAVNKYAKGEMEKRNKSDMADQEAKANQDWHLKREKGVSKYKGYAENEDMLTKILTSYPNKTMLTSITTSENAIELVQYLGKNWEAAERIAKLPQITSAVEIGKLEERLVNRPKKITKARAPLKKVRTSGGSAPSKSNSTLDWIAKRNKEEYNK